MAIPVKPPADIPAVVEAASVWRGCAESHDLPKLASGLLIDETRLQSLLEEQGLFANKGSGCVAYVAATGGESGVASAIFQYTESSGESRTLAFHKTPDGIVVTPGACDCRESARRVLSVPARELSDPGNDVLASIPSNVRWQLGILVPQMMGGIALRESVRPAESTTDAYTVRVVVDRRGDSEPEHLESLEIVESASGKRVDGAWWLQRPDGPGVIIGMEGAAYERLLWQSPVKYVHMSRGVGPSVSTFRRRVPAPKGSPAKSTVVRTIKVREYHIGVDMTAPKGADVHAVGDSTVAFAGRRGGYGNLIILDHGRGYQTYYAHLSKINLGVKAGASISRGDVIGLVGSTGHSTAPHLHFETRKDTRYLDPFDETRQLEFWLLTADDQERLAMQLLTTAPTPSGDEQGGSRQ